MSTHLTSDRKKRSNDSGSEPREGLCTRLSDEPNFGMVYSSAKNAILQKRIAEYLKKNRSSPIFDFDKMVDEMRKAYPEYDRIKLPLSKKIFAKALDLISEANISGKGAGKKLRRQTSSQTSSPKMDFNMIEQPDEDIISPSEAGFTICTTGDPPERFSTTENKLKQTSGQGRDCGGYLSSLSGIPQTSKGTEPCTLDSGDDEEDIQVIEDSFSTPYQKSNSKLNHQKTIYKSSTKKKVETSVGVDKRKSNFEVSNSPVSFSDVGGVDHVLVKITRLLVHLKLPQILHHFKVAPPRGILLHGPPGCGKSLVANAVAGELKIPVVKIAATEIVTGISGESEKMLRELFEFAKTQSPCIIIMDELDAIAQHRHNASKGMEGRIVGQLLACMDSLGDPADGKESQVIVIGITNRLDVLDTALRRAGRFESEIPIGIPDESSRLEILRVLSRDLNLVPNFDLRQLARLTPGYVGSDLKALLREAAINCLNRILLQARHDKSPDETLNLSDLLALMSDETSISEDILSTVKIDMPDFETAVKIVQPSAMREGFATVPNVTWEDIGALEEIRSELETSILAPVKHPEITKAFGMEAPTGILLCGPPGCGKTLLAKAVANESGINFISVKGPELLNKYVGESERAVRQVFERAKNSAPCVIFFDELDSLAPKRSGSGDSSGASRVVNQLLTEMDGVEGRLGVYIMAATNRVDIIDPAILRPGRLQKILHVGLPSPSDRKSILEALTKKKPRLASDVNLQLIAEDPRCDGFSGADLSALVTEASTFAFKEAIREMERANNPDLEVHSHHFHEAFLKVRPSVSAKDKLYYDRQVRHQSLKSPKEDPISNDVC